MSSKPELPSRLKGRLKDRYDLFVFDLDGTLIDSKQDIAHAANATLAHLGYPSLPVEVVANLVGSGVRQLMRDLLRTAKAHTESPSDPENGALDTAYTFFMAHYGAHCMDQTDFYPGARNILDRLNDKAIAVLTNKPTLLSEKILTALKVRSLFNPVIGGDGPCGKKPDPTGLQFIMKHRGIAPSRTLMLGDSPIDIATARAAGCDVAVFSSGFTPAPLLEAENPTGLFSDFQAIGDAL